VTAGLVARRGRGQPGAFSAAAPVALVCVGGVTLAVAGIVRDSSTWWQLLLLITFGGALGLTVATDLRERRIPNAITYPGTLLALVVAGLAGWSVLWMALAGAVVAGGLIWGFARLTRGAIGLGDVKLSAFVGSAVGLGGVPLFLVAGTGAGAVIAAVLLARGRDRRATFAYGPALAIGACITVMIRGLSMF
jgi:leader peptidase (prepilin peptidase) / N-methyltransferase